MDKSWKDLFTFSRRERGGIAVLLAILLVLILLKPFLPKILRKDTHDMEEFRRQTEIFLAELQRLDSLQQLKSPEKADPELTVNLLDSFRARPFFFDPNTIPEDKLRLTGISESAAKNLLKYRKKGGRFAQPEDIKKIYNMDPAWSRAVIPYIIIETQSEREKQHEEDMGEIAEGHPKKEPEKFTPASGSDGAPVIHIELNATDSASLVQCRGIGPSFAKRIITYRELLGGFYDKKQLLEVYGMDTVRYEGFGPQVFADPALVRRMDLNTVEFKEMLRHPYFEYYIVKAVFDYKERKKQFDSIQELKILPEIYPELFEKLSPYLEAGKK